MSVAHLSLISFLQQHKSAGWSQYCRVAAHVHENSQALIRRTLYYAASHVLAARLLCFIAAPSHHSTLGLLVMVDGNAISVSVGHPALLIIACCWKASISVLAAEATVADVHREARSIADLQPPSSSAVAYTPQQKHNETSMLT